MRGGRKRANDRNAKKRMAVRLTNAIPSRRSARKPIVRAVPGIEKLGRRTVLARKISEAR
jgi:hypothetical protein